MTSVVPPRGETLRRRWDIVIGEQLPASPRRQRPGLCTGPQGVAVSMGEYPRAVTTDTSTTERDRLRLAVRRAWTRSTSADPRWSDDNPARGQCAVTALVVQDVLGGELRRAVVDCVSHYWNRLPDGVELDFTREQFERFVVSHVETRERDYVLSFVDTRRRYEELRCRIDKHLIAIGSS